MNIFKGIPFSWDAPITEEEILAVAKAINEMEKECSDVLDGTHSAGEIWSVLGRSRIISVVKK